MKNSSKFFIDRNMENFTAFFIRGNEEFVKSVIYG